MAGVDEAEGRTLRTRPLMIGNDTSIVVHVEFIPVQLPEEASSIVLTASFSAPAAGIRRAAVLSTAYIFEQPTRPAPASSCGGPWMACRPASPRSILFAT